jgi:hypothetical protein
MKRTLSIAFLAVGAAATSWAQSPGAGQTATAVVQSSSEKVRESPAAQFVLVKTVVGKTLGTVDARAEPVEPEGYNLLRYCWTVANVLGDWTERAGLTGQMAVLALETLSWQRDLARVGYPLEATAQAIGRYEATLVSAEFTDAARQRALDALVVELDGLKRTTPGAAQVRTIPHCEGQARSFGLNHKLVPVEGRVRFIPYLLHQICQAQQLDAEDPARCDYWLNGKADGPMSFAGETVFSVRWPDGSTARGRFDPDSLRSAGTVTLRQPPKAK